jgi:aryl-alcohol dehydrogenase-like predicted oxidoreductase
LAWLIGRSGVTSPIVGASKPGHLEAAVDALKLKLSQDKIALLEQL